VSEHHWRVAVARHANDVPVRTGQLVAPPRPHSGKLCVVRRRSYEAIASPKPNKVKLIQLQDTSDIASPGAEVVGYDAVHEKGLPGGFVRKRTKSRHGNDRPLALDDRTVALVREQRARREARAH